MSKRFDVPIKWTTDGVPITGLEFSTIKRVNNAFPSSVSLQSGICGTILRQDRYQKQLLVQLKLQLFLVLTLLSLDKSFWLDLPLIE